MLNLKFAALVVFIGALSLRFAWSDEPLSPNSPAAGGDSSDTARPTVTEARQQARVLHTALHSALQVVHHRYYREDEGLPIPAAVLKEVFAELEQEQHITLRWLAVEGQAMNSDHKPQTDFENEAFKALKSGRRDLEQVENGLYRRAGAITLTNHCLKCHVPDRKDTRNRTAGLVISMRVRQP